MSKRRTLPESSTDKLQTDGNPDSFQEDENTKRAKLTSFSDTTLQDLPMELIESILVKAVAMEVIGMRLARSVWKEKAELVMNRLRTVCPQWNSILSTNYFRNELHRTFDAEKTAIRLEIVQKFQFTGFVYDTIIAFKDELLGVYAPPYDQYRHTRYLINVYDRNNVAEVKDVIPLAGIEPQHMAVCNVSNCMYLQNRKAYHLSVSRLIKIEEHQYQISPLITSLRRRYDTLSVAANGHLVLSWQRIEEQRALIAVYDSNGQLLHETWLTSDVFSSYFSQVIPKSNGNFVLVSRNDEWQVKLIEIDKNGDKILRQYQSSITDGTGSCVFQADKCERIAIVRKFGAREIELLDSELNRFEYTGIQPDDEQTFYWGRMHFNRERDEVVNHVNRHSAIIFRITEEYR